MFSCKFTASSSDFNWIEFLNAGLAAVGVALVASSAKSLTHSTCKSKATMAINAFVAVGVYFYSPTWVFPVLLVAGGCVTLITCRNNSFPSIDEDVADSIGVGKLLGSGLVLVWVVLLVASVAMREGTSYGSHKLLHWWETFYRIGSLIFGGGQVNLTLST